MPKHSDLAFWQYNALDSLTLSSIFPTVEEKLINQGNIDAYNTQSRLLQPLLYMMARGIKMDTVGIEKAKIAAEEELETLIRTIAKESDGVISNPNSTKQIAEYFYEYKGSKPYINRKTGRITTDEMALKRLAKPLQSRPAFPVAKLLLRHRQLAKLKGTYLDVKLDKDNRLRSFFNAGKTVSGRLASSTTIFKTGTNLQNQPAAMKMFMLFDNGYAGYNMDLKQAENKIVANIAPENKMMNAFNTGVDVHALTGSLISGLSVEEVIRQDKAGIKCSIGNGLYTWRFWGKKANHGLNYDLGARNFALLYEISETDARFIIDKYHSAYPGIREYHRWVKKQLEETGSLTNCFGRVREFRDRWGDSLFKAAYDYIPQSTVSSKINEHGLNHIYYNQDKYKEVELLLQVHDSIEFQIPLTASWKRHAVILSGIRDSLEQPVKWKEGEFILTVDLEMGLNMGARYWDNDDKKWVNPKGLIEIDPHVDIDTLAMKLQATYEVLNGG